MLQKEDAPPTAEIGGLEIPLDVPKIMSAEAAATANATGILGLGGGGNKFQAKKDDDAIPRRKLEVLSLCPDLTLHFGMPDSWPYPIHPGHDLHV